MNLDQFMSMVEGYGERLIDQQIISVHSGFWAGYYSGMSKHKKPVKVVLEKIENARYKKKETGTRAPDVDVASFLERERKFKEAQDKKGVKPRGK